jgi:hypothetical protein
MHLHFHRRYHIELSYCIHPAILNERIHRIIRCYAHILVRWEVRDVRLIRLLIQRVAKTMDMIEVNSIPISEFMEPIIH